MGGLCPVRVQVLLVFASLALSACGSAGSGGAGSDGGDSKRRSGSVSGSGCLTSAQVEAQVNKIASGFESSTAEVAKKQRAIRSVRARQCP